MVNQSRRDLLINFATTTVSLAVLSRARRARADDGLIAAGDHVRSIEHNKLERSYRLHVPAGLKTDQPTPLVLALHPFATNAAIMVPLCGLNEVADREGFVIAYPDGTGRGTIRSWNAGGVGMPGIDDVGFLAKVLDEIEKLRPIDDNRVYATGMSNGAMMCHRLAAELSDRFAAIAAISGTLALPKIKPKRPVSIMHFHGTDDKIVPFDGPVQGTPRFIRFLSVSDTIKHWVEANGCPADPVVTDMPAKPGDLDVTRSAYGPGRDDSEVVLYTIDGGGHTWPGRSNRATFLGASSKNFKANEHIWSFFCEHARRS
jgi:polyhydroxybutyrate depolymerase